MGIGHSSGETIMFTDLIKFTAKIAIFAVVMIYAVAPRIPGMPDLADLFHLPTWQQVTRFVLDPGDTVDKGQELAHWAESKMPDVKLPGTNLSIPKPNLIPKPDPLPKKDDSPVTTAKKILDPGGLTSIF
jgi:hypothetical protein